MELSVGTSGFYNRQWKGIFYPESLAAKNWFAHYCEHFDTFEINGSFYKFPTLKIMQNWYDRSPDGFSYAVKAPRVITHFKRFDGCATEIAQFYDVCVNGLREKLGWLLFQTPPSFAFSQERLDSVLALLDPGLPNVIEFRHASWWRDDVKKRLEDANIVLCSPSYPNLPDDIFVCNGIAYIRLHGKPKLFYSRYSEEELSEMLAKASEADKAVIYCNNTASEAGIENALMLKRMGESLSLKKTSK